MPIFKNQEFSHIARTPCLKKQMIIACTPK